MSVEEILKQYNFPESKLKDILKVYYGALKDEVPYPLYFAITKVTK